MSDQSGESDESEGVDARATDEVGSSRAGATPLSELERLRATATSLSELSTGLNEMVETLARIIARDEGPLED